MNPDAWLTGRRGQALAAGIGGLALLLLWFGVIDPVHSWYEDRGRLIERRQALLQRMQQIAATLPAVQAAASARPGDSAGAVMLPGNNDAVAAADLQEQVQKMASAAGASLTAVETLPATSAGQWHKVSLRISLNAPWTVLMELLRSVEQSPERILVDDVHFHTASLLTRSANMPVQASMVLYGFRPAEAGSGT